MKPNKKSRRRSESRSSDSSDSSSDDGRRDSKSETKKLHSRRSTSRDRKRDHSSDEEVAKGHSEYSKHKRSRNDNRYSRDYGSRNEQDRKPRYKREDDHSHTRGDSDHEQRRSKKYSNSRRSRERDNYDRHDRSKTYAFDKERNRDNDNRNRQNEHRRDNRYRNRRSRSRSYDHANAKWGKEEHNARNEKEKPKEKVKPNFGLSGKLAEETNSYRGVVIKYSEPPEARKPKRRWRLYPFKGEKALQTLYIHRESAYLIGRDRKVVDLPVDHPSCSKQHAVLQYRLVPFTREDGSAGKRVRPYLIDLDSANGTYINNKKSDARKFVELLEKDVIKFGYSSREYVLLHENSKDEAQDDDVKQEEEEGANVKQEP